MATLYSNGPSGGDGGRPFSDDVSDSDERIKEIRVRAGGKVDGIQLVYATRSGGADEKPHHGGSGGDRHVFTLDDDEYVVRLYGRCGDVVDSLVIETNKQRSPSYGGSGGRSEYSYRAPDGYEIAGILGRAGGLVDAIGVQFRQRR